MLTVSERFWAKVDMTGECWLWTAATNTKGYGLFRIGKRMIVAHRWSYQALVGEIPKGRQLDHRHTCPKNCVNPGHLRPVTGKQNKENMPGAYACNSTGVRGVTLRSSGKYQAEVTSDGKRYYVGTFASIQEAEVAVIVKRLELFTHNDADREAAFASS